MKKFLNPTATKRFSFAFAVGMTLVLSACGDEGDDNGKKPDGGGFNEALDFEAKVIYGEDDRLDLYQVQDRRFLQLADSTVALMAKSDLASRGEVTQIKTTNFGTSFSPQLCTGERFREQETAAFCSGFLVAPNLVMSAGHCMRTQGTDYSDCSTTAFVFGFGIKKSGQSPTSVPTSEVYHCKSIIKSVLTNNGPDWSLIELDRPVVGHTPLKLRRSGSLKTGDDLMVVGHPSGLPTKVAGGAKVRRLDQAYIVAALDTYGGNSGSAVFNANSLEVEGVLVRGEQDFIVNDKDQCQVSNRCATDGCRGEDVTKISEALPYVPDGGDGGNPAPTPTPPTGEYKVEPKLPVPDNNLTGIASSLFVDLAPNGKSVQVMVNITHPWRGDLIVTVVAPDGTEVVLSNRAGRSLDHIIGTFGGDLTAPGLEKLAAVKRAGEWKLKVSDRASRDTGVLNSWSIKIP